MPLVAPTIAWRAYLGGQPDDGNARFGGPRVSAIVASVGGRFVARDVTTLEVLWSSPVLGSGRVVDSADLDGDGVVETIVMTSQQAHVLDGVTGAVRWSSPLSEIETMGSVRIRDVDGDGLPDVYLDNGFGAKVGTKVAAAYSFAGGVPTELWSLPISIKPDPINSGSDSLVDLDGDGVPEVVLPSWKSLLLVRGDDGTTIAELTPPDPGFNAYAQSNALAAQLDGQPGLELVNVFRYSSSASQQRPNVAAYRVDVTTGAYELLWAADAGSYDAELAGEADIASDLDGDGVAEVVFSARIGTTWTTEVRSGATGQVLASKANARFEGAADLDGAAGAELVLATPAGLGVYKYAAGAITALGAPIAGARALSLSDGAKRAAGQLEHRLAVVAGPAGAPMLVAGSPLGTPGPMDGVGRFTSITGYTLVGTPKALAAVGTYTPVVGHVTGAFRADGATRPYAQLAVGTSEGLVAVFDQHLGATNGLVWLDGSRLGAFVGGTRAAAPALVSSDATGPFVVFPETALGAAVSDVRPASWIVPPVPRWTRPALDGASVIDVGGVPHVVGVEAPNLVARRADTGVSTGSVTLPAGRILGSPLPLRVAGKSSPLVGVDWVGDGVEVAQMAVDFAAAAIAWSGAPLAYGGYFGSAVGDLDGNGTDEWYSQRSQLFRRDAASGAVTTLGDYPVAYYSLPMLAPFSGAATQIMLQASAAGPALVNGDGTVAWTGPVPEPINGMAAARSTCAGAPRLITPAVQSPTLRAYEGATGVIVAERAYAAGQAWASLADIQAAGQRAGVLGHATAVASLGGAPAVLVGSSDGYLYAVDPCTLALRWASNLGASVGEPVIADADGDGADEIVVTAADGFVYGLDTRPFPAPLVAFSGDPGGAVMSVSPGASLAVAWDPIPNAEGYELALVGPDEKPVSSPIYSPVSGVSSTISLAGALAGRPYRVAVRATGSAGAGVEGFSKPFVLADNVAPTVTASAAGGSEVAISITASDDVALDHYLLSVDLGSGGPTLLGDALLSGKSAATTYTFTPAASLRGKDVTLVVTVYDSANLTGEAHIQAHVADDGTVSIRPPEGGSTSSSSSGSANGATPDGAGTTQGCACRVGDAPTPGGGWAALSLLGLLAARRRRAS